MACHIADRAAPLPGLSNRANFLQPAENPIAPSELAARAQAYHAGLVNELRPQNTLEAILVAGISRHAAALELGAAAEAATLQFAVENAHAQEIYKQANAAALPYVAAMGNGLVARATRYRTQHERALFVAMRELRELSRERRSPQELNWFANEEECTAYLTEWQREQPWCCPECGGTDRCWLRKRSRWECPCGRQFTVRHGTLFARSHAPLMAWFQVVLANLQNPNVSSGELAQHVGVVRRATLRAMNTQVQAALLGPLAEQLLGGLPGGVISRLRQAYATRSKDSLVFAVKAEPNHADVDSASPPGGGTSGSFHAATSDGVPPA